VPMPTVPFAGNVFVCAFAANDTAVKKNSVEKLIFIKDFLSELIGDF